MYSFKHLKTKKAQKHQAKCYDARHSGPAFKVGEKLLKRNMRDASCKAKMKNKYSGPCQIKLFMSMKPQVYTYFIVSFLCFECMIQLLRNIHVHV